MASVKVAVRVRPLNKRETQMDCSFIVEMEEQKTRVTNLKIPVKGEIGDAGRIGDRIKEFPFDHCYWTVDPKNARYASQEKVFNDLGQDVIKSAYNGYNACVFAYGQTGSGKTYTMMGTPSDQGLIPRICQSLFAGMIDKNTTYRTEVSYLEIYNEHVRDLLRGSRGQNKLRVREHPKEGPYVQDLSKHIVMNYEDIEEVMAKGNQQRTTAATNMNDTSSRSHAIFTIVFTQARFSKDSPSEMHSKIHLVDLAGSERADLTGATGQRLKEGSSINKSLVTLGNVISTLADMSEKGRTGKFVFIPYRDSVLTWLLKDSLGGNSKTIMIATISPADCNYAEILSTLRYASRAKSIVNKPTVNEDANVKLIRELREEIARLRMLLGGNIDNITTPKVQEKLHENEARIKVLTEEWAYKWKEAANILKEQKTLALRKEGLGVVLDSELPHLIGIDDDILSTGIMLFHLKEGRTTIGTSEAETQQDIVLSGMEVEAEHCIIDHTKNEVTLQAIGDAACYVNGSCVDKPVKLTQGAVILLGRTNMFRFNHPAQAAKLREEFKSSSSNHNLSTSRVSLLSQSMTDLARSTENLSLSMSGFDFDEKHREEMEKLQEKRQQIEELEEQHKTAEAQRLQDQKQREEELESKRTRLEQLTADAEERKRQAEQVYALIKEEKDELKRRSMDIEKQFKDYLEEKEKFQEERENERFRLQQQKKKYESNERSIISEESSQDEQIEDMIIQKEALISNMEKELSNIESQKEHMISVKSNIHTALDKTSDYIRNDAIEELEIKQAAILDAHENIQRKEKSSYVTYKNEKDKIEEENKKMKQFIQDSGEQLEADEVILQEAWDQYDQAKNSSDVDLDQLQKEKTAIDLEEERLAVEVKKLQQMEDDSDLQYKKQIENLELKRCADIDEINAEKDKLTHLKKDKINFIDLEIDKIIHEQEKIKNQLKVEHEQLHQLKQDTQTGSAAVHSGISAPHTSGGQDATDNHRKDSVQEETEVNSSQTVSDSDDLDRERDQLNIRIEELKALENQLTESENELESRRQKYEDEREQELDKIDFEKFRLQEMEHEERINALVEQEVKRRLFEERVQREKQRRIERERENRERQAELTKIKKSHDREMQKLRQKYEGNYHQPNGGPTKANPYASILHGDVSVNDTRIRSRSQRSSSHSSSSSSVDKVIRVHIPSFTLRGYGIDAHYEFEVKITVGEENWTVFRRYSRFRDLHNDLKSKFPEVAALDFPPKRFFGNRSEKVAIERKKLLECYVQNMLDVVMRNADCPLHKNLVSVYNKQLICQFHHFFRKGIFEATKHGTG